MNSMQMKMLKDAINAAESNIRVAKNLLYQMDEGRSERFDTGRREQPDGRRMNRFDRSHREQRGRELGRETIKEDNRELVGIFNGVEMVTQSGKKYVVPRNYISKSVIVEGDTLKLVKDEGEEKFKQIRRVKRKRLIGTLTQKDGEMVVITEAGSFQVIPEAVAYYKAKEGNKLTVLIPSEKKSTWASIEGLAAEEKQELPAEEKKEDIETPKKKTKGKKAKTSVKESSSEDNGKKDKEEKVTESQVIFSEKKIEETNAPAGIKEETVASKVDTSKAEKKTEQNDEEALQ